jgi:hypothetical protein
MIKIRLTAVFFFVASLCLPIAFIPCTQAQQTLGGVTGTVSDPTGSVLTDTTVTVVGDQTQLTRELKTNASGSYDFVNLPIGTYTLTFTHEGFQTQKIRRSRCRRIVRPR